MEIGGYNFGTILKEGVWGERETSFCSEFAYEYAVGRVARSFRRTYEEDSKMWLGMEDSYGRGAG